MTFRFDAMRMKLYQVKDWQKHFENNKSRERKACAYVCVPNKQHGLGFSRTMAEPDGAMIYGIWVLILGACSRQHGEEQPRKELKDRNPDLPRNGWATHDGHRAGIPWAPDDMAAMFRRPVAEVIRALSVLVRIDWITEHEGLASEVPTDCPESVPVVPAQCPPDALEEKRRELKGRELNRTEEKPGAAVEPPPAPIAETQESWLEALTKDDGYEGIEVRREFAKMLQWCKTNRREPTKRRFVNWLNRIERPLTGNGAKPIDYSKGF